MARSSFILRGLGVVLVVLFMGAIYLIAFPSWILRPAVLSRITTYLDSVGVHLDYELERGHLSWGGWAVLNVELALPHFCLRTDGIEELCLYEGVVQGSLQIFPFDILQVKHLDVREAKLNLAPTKMPTAQEPKETPTGGFSLPGWITTVGTVQIRQFLVEAPTDGGNLTQANASIECLPQKKDLLSCGGALTLAILEAKEKTNLRVTFELLKPRDRLAGDIHVQATVQNPSLPMKHVAIHGHLENDYDSLEFSGTLRADAPVPVRVGVEHCRLSGFHGDTIGLSHCKVSPVIRTIKNLDIKMDLFVEGELHLIEQRGKVRLQVSSAGAKSLTAAGNFEVDFKPCEGGISVGVHPTSEIQLKLAEYQDVVNTLKKTRWAIPAPLNSLGGSVLLNASDIRTEGSRLVFPISFRTELGSKTQRLDTQVSGIFRMGACLPSTEVDLDLKSVLNDVALDLPPLTLSEPPQLAPDPRIGNVAVDVPQEPTSPPAFPWRVNLRTGENSVVRLKSNLTATPIRLKTEMDLSSKTPPSGYVEILPLELELFRRSATVKRLRATLLKERSNETLLDIEGLLNVEYPDYSVDIKISGSSKSPRVNLQSSPPLSQREIIALLLFGEVPAGLDFDKTESIQNMDAALAERSIGLASLYFFAKTPIQSVSYNPNTKGITVRVRLGDKTVISATGTGSGPNKIGLRRRIGKNWAVSTELDLDETSQSTPMSSFLEWFTRY